MVSQKVLTLLSLPLFIFPFRAEGVPLILHTRGQVETAKWVAPAKVHAEVDAPVSTYPFTYVHKTVAWEPAKTAVVIVNLWDQLKAPYAWRRMDELAPAINATARAAREKGLLVVHAPEGTMDFYKDTPQRARCKEVPLLSPAPLAPVALPLPTAIAELGWDGPIRAGKPQTRQHPAIEIQENDAIGEGAEVYSLLKQRGIENVILMGVHTNGDLLDGPTGARQMQAQGLNVLLVRDLTDSRYNPEKNPGMPHVCGTELAVEYLEQLGFPSIESTDLTGEAAFRLTEDERFHIVFIVSDDHYHADKTLPDFARYLRENEGFHASVLHGEGGNSIPGMENLTTADVVVVFVRRLGLPAEQLQRLREFVASGKSVIGLRTASHAFKLKNAPDGTYPVPEGSAEWGSFDHDVLGGNYKGHGSNELGADIKVVNPGHPVMSGVAPLTWHSAGSLYNAKPIAADATLLMEGSTAEGTEPVAWLRDAAPGHGKVFYTSLGHPNDFKEPGFRTLLVNALRWAVSAP